MNYAASVADFFKSPRWIMNMILGGLCVLLPIIGPMVVLGWLITGFWARQDENFETFPAFDFSHLDKYLKRGLWPFLVTFVASMVMVPLIWALMIPMMLFGVLSSSGNEQHTLSCLGTIAMLLVMLVIAVVMFAMMLVMVPLKIRASITQDFAKAFDFGFVRRFLALTWKEVVLSLLFVLLTGALFFCLGVIVFCVGVYFASVLGYFSWTHLHKQLYALYLSRGGEPVPFSPELSDAPPPMPVA